MVALFVIIAVASIIMKVLKVAWKVIGKFLVSTLLITIFVHAVLRSESAKELFTERFGSPSVENAAKSVVSQIPEFIETGLVPSCEAVYEMYVDTLSKSEGVEKLVNLFE